MRRARDLAEPAQGARGLPAVDGRHAGGAPAHRRPAGGWLCRSHHGVDGTAQQMSVLLTPGRLGPLDTRNRMIRAGTSETMARVAGEVTPQLAALYARLGQAQTGAIFTGHLFCHPRGRYARRQTGIYDDRLIPGLREVAEGVHRGGGLVLAQVAHAGSQSRAPDVEPVAPSAVPNALTGREVPAATEGDIAEAIKAFADGARRAVDAGFDGVHIHGANGYLITE